MNAVEHKTALATSHKALVKLFEMRSGAIADGIAQAKARVAASPAAEGNGKAAGK